MKRLPEFSIHPFAPAGIFLLLFAMPRETAFSVVCVVILHELGHAAAALMLKKRLIKLTLMPMGIKMKLSPAASYAEDIAIAAAGPFMNVTILLFSPLFSCAQEIFSFSLISLIINILPMATLDGGRIVKAATAAIFDEIRADRAVRALSVICLFFLWILAVYVFFYTAENVTLLLFCSYIFAGYIIKNDDVY